MSYLSLPRVHFWGMFGVSTPTTNNNNYDLVLDPDNVGFHPPFDQMDDATFRRTMMSLELKNFGGFLGLGIEEVLNGNWNYFGDNSVTLTNCSVFAIDTPQGRLTSPSQDPLIGAQIQMQGDNFGDNPTPAIMVDNDPTGDLSTQIFSSQFNIGSGGCMITAKASAGNPLPRAFSRWIYILSRNLVETPDATFSAIWQQALPNANLAFDNTGNSATLQALNTLAGQGLGLQMRYCTYFFKRRYTDPEMAQFYQQNNFVLNESQGIVLGTLGVWAANELGTFPPGRMLIPNSTCMTYGSGANQRSYTLSPALAMVDSTRNVVVLDLVSSFPEVTNDLGSDPRSLAKIDLGAATLQVVDGDGSVAAIGKFAYDSDTYVSGGGIVEVPFSPSQLAQIEAGTLQVACASATVPYVLAEQVAVAESDDHCVYLTEGQSIPLTFRAWERGAPPANSLPVAIEQFRVTEYLSNPDDPKLSRPISMRTLVPNSSNTPPPFLTINPTQVAVDSSGVGTITLTGIQPGVGILRLVPGNVNPPDPAPENFPSWMNLFYINVRVLPADAQFDSVPDSQLTYQYIYENVLQYYYRLYPIMDRHMLLNNQQAVVNAAPILRQLVDQSNWNSTLYMPITRELSDGKRRLLQRWCDLQP
jgi:hypothetical protein